MKTKKTWTSKIILGLLCVLMLMTAAACAETGSEENADSSASSAEAASDSPVGEWTISSVRVAGVEMSLADAGVTGAEMKIEADGTMQGSTNGTVDGEGTWEESGDIYVFDMDGAKVYGHVEDGKLLLYDTQDYESAQQVMIFERG